MFFMNCDCCLDATVLIAYLVRACRLCIYSSLSICGPFWLPRLERKKKICVQYVVGNNRYVFQSYTPASLQVFPQVEKCITWLFKN